MALPPPTCTPYLTRLPSHQLVQRVGEDAVESHKGNAAPAFGCWESQSYRTPQPPEGAVGALRQVCWMCGRSSLLLHPQ